MSEENNTDQTEETPDDSNNVTETPNEPPSIQVEKTEDENEHSSQQASKTELQVEEMEKEEQVEEDEFKHEDELIERTSEVSQTDINLMEKTNQQVEEELENHPLNDLTDQQVIDLVQELETENRHLQVENILFESFLHENDESLLDGIDEIMEFLLSSDLASTSSTDQVNVQSKSTDKLKFKLDSYTSITSIAEGKGPKINLAQKTDMVMRAMEDTQSKLETFLKKSHVTRRNLKSELQEFSIREAEIKEATDIFEYNVVVQGVDKLTQRIPAEKFIRYMDEWLRSAQFQIEKLRLRIATLKGQYKKVSHQLIQRQELGENVHAVDFDQLEIENKHFKDKIEQKNTHLIELKKMNGGANLVLSTHKKTLQKLQEDCTRLKEEIDAKNNEIASTEKECEQADDELKAEIEKYENCKKLKYLYVVPDVMEYVKLKVRLEELRKNIKIWIRRKKIQDIAFNTCLREMKNLTGKCDIDPSWFEEELIDDDVVSDDLFFVN